MKTIAVGQHRVTLPFRAEDGSQPLVVAMPYEHVSDVVLRVRSIGGHANVAVAFARNFSLVVMDSDDTEAVGPEMEVNEDLSMGMFLIAIGSHPSKKTRFRFRESVANVPVVQRELAYN
ncbi:MULTISPECIES: hypothetical protein [Cryobacterium]|uniref:Uncharacterized protein n=1 Tax=Cryobacterium breve TaxID=1259258 RepID=A0ABY2J4H2_9MICO|nr:MULTISPECIES: hypothetical protein [Cryobacterium]TFC92028.1 hypothetical protein E3T20_11985 [Cryobacterium sp. TmT3-12]TFC99833.1 hypothetical protein E3O65_05520 [Cryobacterium breve]